jgi:hypothetical protein
MTLSHYRAVRTSALYFLCSSSISISRSRATFCKVKFKEGEERGRGEREGGEERRERRAD